MAVIDRRTTSSLPWMTVLMLSTMRLKTAENRLESMTCPLWCVCLSASIGGCVRCRTGAVDDLFGRAEVGSDDLRMLDHVGRQATGDDGAELEGDQLVGHRGDQRHVVLDHEQRA